MAPSVALTVSVREARVRMRAMPLLLQKFLRCLSMRLDEMMQKRQMAPAFWRHSFHLFMRVLASNKDYNKKGKGVWLSLCLYPCFSNLWGLHTVESTQK